MELPRMELVGVYFDLSDGLGLEGNMRICLVERTREGTLVCRNPEGGALRVVLSHIDSSGLEVIMDALNQQCRLAS